MKYELVQQVAFYSHGTGTIIEQKAIATGDDASALVAVASHASGDGIVYFVQEVQDATA